MSQQCLGEIKKGINSINQLQIMINQSLDSNSENISVKKIYLLLIPKSTSS